jgi:hypothetical protein
MTAPQPYDNGGNISAGVRVVSSLDEWAAYADETDEPVAHAVGELADQIRERFGESKHVPVILTEAYDSDDGACECCTHYAEYLVIECGEHVEQIDRANLTASFQYWLDEPRRRAAREAAAAASREHEQKVADFLTASIVGALDAVEAEGYSSDGEWHDQLMRRLGVRGYQQ